MFTKIKYFNLIKELVKRDIFLRYKGSIFGIWWTLIMPLTMLAIFTFVFGTIFQARWHGGAENIAEFALKLYAGLIIFWFFNEIMNKAPTIIASQPNFVKKVIFPLEILPIVSVLSALFHLAINVVILYLVALAVYSKIYLTFLMVPFIAATTIPMLLGVGWMLAALGVYIKDIANIIGIFMSMLMFLSPIFYPIDAIDKSIRWVFYFNPVTLPIEWTRASVCDGLLPQWDLFAIYTIVSFITFFIGFYFFKAMRKGFADVL
jgi:lipopolysaccharide transport system permease protein